MKNKIHWPVFLPTSIILIFTVILGALWLLPFMNGRQLLWILPLFISAGCLI